MRQWYSSRRFFQTTQGQGLKSKLMKPFMHKDFVCVSASGTTKR